MDKKRIRTIITCLLAAIVLVIAGVFLVNWLGSQQGNNHTSTADQNTSINRYSSLSDITFDDDKINIYVFWGDGCIHCEDLYGYLDEIWNEYSQYANIYSFEIWNNDDNGKILDYFLEQFDKKTGERSTPIFIIGNEIFEGFNDNSKDKIKQTIIDQYNNRDSIRDFSDVTEVLTNN